MKKYTKALEKEIERIKKTGMVSESFITGFEAATNRIRNMEELPTPSPEMIEEIKPILPASAYENKDALSWQSGLAQQNKINELVEAVNELRAHNALRREGGVK